MPEENLSIIVPVPVAFLVCDQVSQDSATGKKTIVGVFNNIASTLFPAQHSQLSLYIKLIDCEGFYQSKIDFVRVSTQEKLLEAVGTVSSNDRHEYSEIVVPFPRVPLPAPGEYEFRFWMNGKFISHVRFTAIEISTEEVQ